MSKKKRKSTSKLSIKEQIDKMKWNKDIEGLEALKISLEGTLPQDCSNLSKEAQEEFEKYTALIEDIEDAIEYIYEKEDARQLLISIGVPYDPINDEFLGI